MKRHVIIGITPFEKADASLAIELQKAGIFPVLNIGHDRPAAEQSLEKLVKSNIGEFGVCFPGADLVDIKLDDLVSTIIIPYGTKVAGKTGANIIYQVFDIESARLAKADGAAGIIIKGNESAGKVGYESSFVLFQRIIQEINDIPVWVQGGIGLHTAAAITAQGARV